jgi:hypothetical protein
MVCDALDETGKGLLRLIVGRVFHTLNSGNAGSNIAAWSARQLIRLRRAQRRAKLEPTATILLANSVAAHDNVMDGRAKIFKENNMAQNVLSQDERAVTEFRVRCFIRRFAHRKAAAPIYHFAAGAGQPRGFYVEESSEIKGLAASRISSDSVWPAGGSSAV